MELVQLIHHKETRRKLAACLETQHSKIVSMLVWCGIAILSGYLLILLEALEIYFGTASGYRWYLIPALILLFLPFGGISWKIFVYVPKKSRAVVNGLFNWNVAEHNRQLKWLLGVVIIYFFITQISCALLWAYAGRELILISGSTLYCLGIILLIKLSHARKTVVNYLRLTDRRL